MTPTFSKICSQVAENKANTLRAVKGHAESLMNHSPRFKFFTLHGTQHFENLFEILLQLQDGGIKLSEHELYLLSLAICIHDLGMVVSLAEKDTIEILEGRPEATDPAALEEFIRTVHHELVDAYYQDNLGFLLALGISPPELALVRDISRCHRKVFLHQQLGLVKYLGALLRVIDELDLGSNRAPIAVFRNLAAEMDATSCWHWFKHNIVAPWTPNHTLLYKTEGKHKTIEFILTVHPSKVESTQYWLRQIRGPIWKAIDDNGAGEIIKDHFGVSIKLTTGFEMSGANNLGEWWGNIEDRALSAGRKVILVIDDEFRKLEDLFVPLQDDYHVLQARNAKEALVTLKAKEVDLAIVDMQIGSGGLWSEDETDEFKRTGIKLCREIRALHPATIVGILTGTKHSLPALEELDVSFFWRKPIDPNYLKEQVHAILR